MCMLWKIHYRLSTALINTFRPRQNCRHFADDIFKCILLNKNVWILIKISVKFLSKGPNNNIPALVQIMAWRRPGDKRLCEAMMVSLPTQYLPALTVCVVRPTAYIWRSSSHPGSCSVLSSTPPSPSLMTSLTSSPTSEDDSFRSHSTAVSSACFAVSSAFKSALSVESHCIFAVTSLGDDACNFTYCPYKHPRQPL